MNRAKSTIKCVLVITILVSMPLGEVSARQVCSQEPGQPRGCYEDPNDGGNAGEGGGGVATN
jgi:hypothetical protein